MPHANSLSRKSSSSDGIDLPRIAGILLDQKYLIALITLIFIFLGAIYAVLSTPAYRADALVQIEQASRSNPLADVTTLLGKEPPSQAEIEIISSRMVLGRTVDTLNLDVIVTPTRVPIIGEFLNRMGVARPQFAKDWHYVWSGESINVENLSVSKDKLKKTFELEILSASSYRLWFEDEDLGIGESGVNSEFLNSDISIYISQINAPPGSTFLLTRIPRLLAITELKKDLTIKEKGLETGILSWTLVGPDPETAEMVLRTISEIYVAQNIRHRSEEARSSLEFLEEQLPKVRTELTAAENQLNAYRIDKESVDLSLETRSVLERLVNLELQLNELELTEAEISRRFTPTHPTYAALLDKKRQLQKEKANIENKIESLPETQQQILRLQRDASVNQETYVQLRNKVQEMQIVEASTVGNVRILDSAQGFPKPVRPNKKLILVYAAIFGLMVSISFILLLGLLKSGVNTQEDLEALGLSVYATVPLAKEQSSPNKKRKQVTSANHLLAVSSPTDGAIEALRGLRTSLYFNLNNATNKRLMITSASPGAGKSFIATNLAAVCAHAGQRVLLIDGDMRKGTIHSIFGENPDGGLSDILSGRPLTGLVRSVNGIENLHYLARGIAPPNPSELLAKPRFEKLIKAIEPDYDLIIIDSPPALAVTDAAIIGRHVGSTLLVVRFEFNSTKEIELTLNQLRHSGISVSGSILNAVDGSSASAYGLGNYNYAYTPNT